MKPATVATRDNLLAILHGNDKPMTTSQLAAELPWASLDVLHEAGWHRNTSRRRLIRCDGSTDLIQQPLRAPSIYPHLRALERAGLVICRRIGNSAWWDPVEPPSVSTDELWAMWGDCLACQTVHLGGCY